MIELFIEKQPVDVDKGFSTLLTYAVDDIRDFGAKNTTFSKTIILPGTKRNNLLFGNIFEVTGGNDYDSTKPNQGTNFNAAVSASAMIFCDNIQVFKGIVRVMEIIIDNGVIEYEVSVFGELGGFASKLGNLKLEDLDFSAYNAAYSVLNITNSWNTIAGSGLYYPLMDYGTYSTDKNNWKVKTFRPALYAKEYIDKIFAKAGYSYNCDLFNTARFKSIIIPHNQKLLTKNKSNILTASRTVDETVISDVSFNDAAFTFPTSAGSIFSITPSRFTYNGTETINTTLSFNFTYSFKTTNNTILLSLKKNGVIVVSKTLPDVAGMTFTGSWVIDQPLNLATTDYIEFFATVSNSLAGNLYNFIHKTGSISIISSSAIPVPVNLGDTIALNDILPKNILQKDFFSSIVKLFNLYVYEDPENDKLLKIKPFTDFFISAKTVDWSLKLDRSKPIRVKPMSELNARYYEFAFKDDSDYYNDLYKKRYNKAYGSLVYDSAFEFAKETETVELIFSGTPLVGYSGKDKVYSTIFKSNNNIEESIDSNIRLLQAKKMAALSYNILADDGTTILSSQVNYGYAGHLNDPDAPTNDLQFGVPEELFFTLKTGGINVNQFNTYWSTYMAEITDKDNRLLTGIFKLNYKDIYTLDFSKFIYLNGCYWRLNKIEDFNATDEDTCKVELLKVVNMSYVLPEQPSYIIQLFAGQQSGILLIDHVSKIHLPAGYTPFVLVGSYYESYGSSGVINLDPFNSFKWVFREFTSARVNVLNHTGIAGAAYSFTLSNNPIIEIVIN